MKVWMVCSVKGTPICTRSPWNKARKKLMMSSTMSGRKGRVNEQHVRHDMDVDTRCYKVISSIMLTCSFQISS